MQYESRPRRTSDQERRPHDGGPEFWISTENERDGYILALYGELDVASAPLLERQLKKIQWAGASSIVLDLSGLDFIDSTGLHVLIRAHRRAQEGQLSLLRGSQRVHRVFELTKTDTVLPFVG
jgi:anti-sigma B factor antagonist